MFGSFVDKVPSESKHEWTRTNAKRIMIDNCNHKCLYLSIHSEASCFLKIRIEASNQIVIQKLPKKLNRRIKEWTEADIIEFP